MALGVFSDYPVASKLEAMGLGGAFGVMVCATDDGVNAYKPDPAGFRAAAAAFRLAPSEVLMVGDRAEMDGEGARAAGMPAVIVGRSSPRDTPRGYVHLRSLADLRQALGPREGQA